VGVAAEGEEEDEEDEPRAAVDAATLEVAGALSCDAAAKARIRKTIVSRVISLPLPLPFFCFLPEAIAKPRP
jgi:hypothetical protein